MRKRVAINHETGCHEVISQVYRLYPTVKIHGKHVRVNRLSYMLYHGPIPAKMNILHKCDNTKCINPDHLYAGTQKDNMIDLRNPGRWGIKSIKHDKKHSSSITKIDATAPGQDHSTAKLTNEQVLEIRSSSESCSTLADRYRLARGTISKIRNRHLWKHLP